MMNPKQRRRIKEVQSINQYINPVSMTIQSYQGLKDDAMS